LSSLILFPVRYIRYLLLGSLVCNTEYNI